MNRSSNSAPNVTQYAGLVIVLGILILVFGLTARNFLQWGTVRSIANQIPPLTFLAVGMTWVLIVGGIDLSVGSLLALSSAVLGVLMADFGWSLYASIPLCVLAGAGCGLLSGAISVGCAIPSFIVTLGMLETARGVTKVIMNSQVKYIGADVEMLGTALPGVLVSPAFLAAAAAVGVGQWALHRTVFGRYCVAIGCNAEAVRMSGIRTAPYSIGVFVISGALCGLAGIAQTSLLSSSDPNAAVGIELSAIAACVIGGTSLMGGKGSCVASFLGVLVIAVLQTGLAHVGVSDAKKQIITGVVIIVSVLIDAWRRGSMGHD